MVDWFSEEYSPQFAQQTEPESNGDLVLMSATAAYEEASANPGMQLMESWMNRVAPGYHQDIFAILAWSAGLAFEQAAKAVGPDLTRAALITQIQQITNWTGGGVTPPVNIGQKIPSKCFFYMKIENGAFQRVYPSAPNTYDCNSGFVPVLKAAPTVHEFLEFTVIGIVLGSAYAVAASGLVVTYATSGIFNIAHGAIGMFMAFVYWQLSVGLAHATPAWPSSSPCSCWRRSSAPLVERGVIQWMDPATWPRAGRDGRADAAPLRPRQHYSGSRRPASCPQFFGLQRLHLPRRASRPGRRPSPSARPSPSRSACACSSTGPGPASPCAASSTTAA